jgi:hypothetical protein
VIILESGKGREDISLGLLNLPISKISRVQYKVLYQGSIIMPASVLFVDSLCSRLGKQADCSRC